MHIRAKDWRWQKPGKRHLNRLSPLFFSTLRRDAICYLDKHGFVASGELVDTSEVDGARMLWAVLIARSAPNSKNEMSSPSKDWTTPRLRPLVARRAAGRNRWNDQVFLLKADEIRTLGISKSPFLTTTANDTRWTSPVIKPWYASAVSKLSTTIPTSRRFPMRARTATSATNLDKALEEVLTMLHRVSATPRGKGP